jgi:type IV pilus assembly protein PilA
MRGFALIELMIAVAIVAILAAIAMPLYQGYVAKSQVAAALAMVRPGKTTIETAIAEHRDVSIVDADYVGLRTSSACPSIDVILAEDYVARIECHVAGNSKVDGKSLGNTLFASTRAAYDDLSDDLKQKLKNKRAIHNVSIRFQRNKDRGVLGRPELSPEEKARTPDRVHPLFRTHHRTGRRPMNSV